MLFISLLKILHWNWCIVETEPKPRWREYHLFKPLYNFTLYERELYLNTNGRPHDIMHYFCFFPRLDPILITKIICGLRDQGRFVSSMPCIDSGPWRVHRVLVGGMERWQSRMGRENSRSTVRKHRALNCLVLTYFMENLYYIFQKRMSPLFSKQHWRPFWKIN